MTEQKLLNIIEFYRDYFVKRKVHQINYAHDKPLKDEMHGLEHCHGMLDQMVEFINEGRIDKAFRWLGFIQGVLWALRVFPLNTLKDHNRSNQ